MNTFHATDAIQLLGEMKERYDEILTPQALEFVAKLQRKFNPERLRLMNLRKERQARIDAGELPDFLPLMLEFLYAADWLHHPHGLMAMQTVISILEDGTYQLMKSLESKGNPYYPLIKALRETFKLCLSQEVKVHEPV